MDDFRRSSQVPAFGGWDFTDVDALPFTQCFESARQAGLVRYGSCYQQERDLYVAGDLYQNDVVTPAVIVVPRRRTKGGQAHAKKQRQHQHTEWGYESSYDTMKDQPSPLNSPPPPPPRRMQPAPRRPTAKAVDEDLYEIPTEFLRPRPKRKGGFGFFSSCLMPVCV